MQTFRLLLIDPATDAAAAEPAWLPPDAEVQHCTDADGAEQASQAQAFHALLLGAGQAAPPWSQRVGLPALAFEAASARALLDLWRDWRLALARPQDGAAQALESHFGGRRALFEAFYEGCKPQFLLDLQRGDEALASADCLALMHLAHSLKGVLLLLGEALSAVTARELEHLARQGELPALAPLWAQLRSQVAELAQRRLVLPPGS